MPATEISDVADEALKWFKVKPRPGTKEPATDTIIVMKDGKPDWVKDMALEVHDGGRWMPDDYKFEYIHDALEALSAGDDPDEPRVEADVYTSDLLNWLSSHLERQGYVDEFIEEVYGREFTWPQGGITEVIGWGQVREKEEVWRIVAENLRRRAEEL